MNDLLLDCSDAHDFSCKKDKDKKPIKDRIGKCFTWIKAQPTFEGLKQIIYDYDSRVFIGKSPSEPLNYIQSFSMNIPINSEIETKTVNYSSEKVKFCFSGLHQRFNLSKYFNCIIGGRGTGKSTLLNLIGLQTQTNNSPSQDYWEKIIPHGFSPSDSKQFNISPETSRFDFLGQNQIDELVSSTEKLTAIIYEKLSTKSRGELEEIDQDILTESAKMKNAVENINSYMGKKEDLGKLEEEKKYIESIFDLFKKDGNKDDIVGIRKKISFLSSLKPKLSHFAEHHTTLVKKLDEIVKQNKVNETPNLSLDEYSFDLEEKG